MMDYIENDRRGILLMEDALFLNLDRLQVVKQGRECYNKMKLFEIVKGDYINECIGV